MIPKYCVEKFQDREYKKERKNPDGSDTYWCPMCKKYLSRGMFHKHTLKKYGISSACKECLKDQKYMRSKSKRPRSRLDKTDRYSLDGFIFYFSKRTFLFKEIFRVEYSTESATKIFNEMKGK
jgi:hypothetical protein